MAKKKPVSSKQAKPAKPAKKASLSLPLPEDAITALRSAHADLMGMLQREDAEDGDKEAAKRTMWDIEDVLRLRNLQIDEYAGDEGVELGDVVTLPDREGQWIAVEVKDDYAPGCYEVIVQKLNDGVYDESAMRQRITCGLPSDRDKFVRKVGHMHRVISFISDADYVDLKRHNALE